MDKKMFYTVVLFMLCIGSGLLWLPLLPGEWLHAAFFIIFLVSISIITVASIRINTGDDETGKNEDGGEK